MTNDTLGISLADYSSGQYDNSGSFGDANTSPEALAELSKALEAGEITGRETTDSATDSGAPLKVESLEKNLKNLTFKESDIQVWKRVPKLAAYNTVEEYLQLVSYGNDRGGFVGEGELAEEEDTIYTRRAQLVKFLRVTKSVTHPMTLVNTNIGPIIQKQVEAGTLWILRKANRSLVYGDSRFVPKEYNGLYSQHEQNDAFASFAAYMSSTSVIDLRGKNLREKDLESGNETIIENFGQGDLLMAPPRVLSDFVKNFYSSKLIQPNSPQVTDGVMGQAVNKVMTQFGIVELAYDKFLNQGAPRIVATAATSPKAPTVPALTPAAAATVSDVPYAANWTGFTGDYSWLVTAINEYGESVGIAANAALLTVGANVSVDLTFTDGGGVYPATAYQIYRTPKSPANTTVATTLHYPIFTVSVAQLAAGYDGGAAGVVRDRNRWIPQTSQAFLIESDIEVWSFKQLAPLMKLDLAVLSAATRFMIMLYGTPMLYAGKKMVRYINIGTDLT